MNLDKQNSRRIRGLIVFTALVLLGVVHIETVIMLAVSGYKVVFPFILGGCIAFIINIPMKAIEKGLFSKVKNKILQKYKRSISVVLAIVFVTAIILTVMGIVIPQIGKTAVKLGNQIPVFVNQLLIALEDLFKANPQIIAEVEKFQNIQIDWKQILNSIFRFFSNGFGNVVSSTVSAASSFFGGVLHVLIAFIFSVYLLTQKEKLGQQTKSVCNAYLPEKKKLYLYKIYHLLHTNFTNFITGQCLEAVILGTIFVVIMSIFGFPYALLVGVLIAFTALIPVVGAFIGCSVGVFLILMEDPMKALWFLIMFLIIQQIEGNLIYPHVVGNSVGLPSIWVLVAVTIGGSVMGVPGILVFIPLFSTLYALAGDAVRERNRRKRITDIN